ncbi:MAG: DNA replication/repair protein RecF [Flavobacteriales bacterium]|nr:DNA replication/repair protein RecF [Flavobacteriales bacterium]
MPAIVLNTISLTHFKNYNESELEFSPGINCLLGDNGSGKTNVLDAIHYLGFSKSYFNHVDSQNILHDEEFFILRGNFSCGESEDEVSCSVRKGQRKILKRNKKEYEKLADHIGLLPVVMISPDDIELVIEGSEVRRRFLDSVISQYSQPYLHNLMAYNHALMQRNNLLKNFSRQPRSERQRYDALEPWDMQLVDLGTTIYAERKKFVEAFTPTFSSWYQQLSGGKEVPALHYESHLNETDFATLLKSCLEKDLALERTSAGTHKDDLEFLLDGYALKKFGSQGQKKTYLIALKWAQFGFIANAVGKLPILMLDDIFDKMDEKRTAHLLQLLSHELFGQVFITDTHRHRVPHLLNEAGLNFRPFNVQSGMVSEETIPIAVETES